MVNSEISVLSKKLRPWLHFAHTGEFFGGGGQTVAGVGMTVRGSTRREWPEAGVGLMYALVLRQEWGADASE